MEHSLYRQFLADLELTPEEFRLCFISEIEHLPDTKVITLASWIRSDGSQMNPEQEEILIGVLSRVATQARREQFRS